MRRAPGAPADDRPTGLSVDPAVLPGPARREIDRYLGALDAGPVVSAEPVAGGCINHGVRLSDGSRSWFAKWNDAAPPGLFRAEAAGLDALRTAGPIRVPEVVGVSTDGAVPWILMEDVPPGRPGPDWDERAGRGLALLHRESAEAALAPGWPSDNWIGTLPQANGPVAPWSAFWRDRRLRPQVLAARERGHLQDAVVLDRLLDRVDDLLAPVDERAASLLHGDLWSGNAYADAAGAPVLVDPAVYRGHGEVDVAMTELFGGFRPDFYAAYAEIIPLDDAYRSVRRPLYQLYYLLVHVNLFGAGYVGRTLAAARSALEGAS